MKRTIIFGASLMGQECYEVLNALDGYETVGFADNDRNKQGTKLFGLPVVSAENLKNTKDTLILIGSIYYTEISEQLEKMGITDYCDNIHKIIGVLSPEERKKLKQALENTKLHNINLDYTINTKVIANDDEGDNDRFLVISGGSYPSQDDPSLCAFAHRRILHYMKEGLKTDVYSFMTKAPAEALDVYEYEGVRVFKGDYIGLEELLKTKKYKKILIHFVNELIIYSIDKSPMKDCSLLIWCHGIEFLTWRSRYFNYTEEEMQKNADVWDRNDAQKMKVLKKIFVRDNIRFIFVSKWMKDMAYKSVGIMPKNYNIIHNYIDSETFIYEEKDTEYRKKILSIKCHDTRKYANDITAKAILELSKKECFKDLTFCLCGEGRLWDENFGELQKRNFENVIFKRKIFTADEMQEEFHNYGIFLSPTRQDAQGVTCQEAMSAGLCAISCNTTAIGEFMDEECASLYEFDNYRQLADEIEFLYYHPDEFKKKAINGAKRAHMQCGYSETITKEIDLILSGSL